MNSPPPAVEFIDGLTTDEVLDLLGPTNARDKARWEHQAKAAWEPPVPLDGGTVLPFPVDARDVIAAPAALEPMPKRQRRRKVSL